jgi:hypothetical protein
VFTPRSPAEVAAVLDEAVAAGAGATRAARSTSTSPADVLGQPAEPMAPAPGWYEPDRRWPTWTPRPALLRDGGS